MNKKEIIKEVAQNLDVTMKDCELIINALFEEITKTLEKGESVVLSNFGTFEVRERKARNGINPASGETISIPKQKTVAFKPGKNLKDRVR